MEDGTAGFQLGKGGGRGSGSGNFRFDGVAKALSVGFPEDVGNILVNIKLDLGVADLNRSSS